MNQPDPTTELRALITDVLTPFFANFSDEPAARANAREAAAALAAVLPGPAATRSATPSAAIRKTLQRWAYAAGYIESELDVTADRMYAAIARDIAAQSPAAPAVPPALTSRAADDLPARLEAALTERFTELGNPFSRMSRREKGPDGWPAEHPVGPHHVAEVLRELQAATPAVDESEDRCAECGHFRGAHVEAEEPVSVGRCTVCANEDEWHDFEAMDEVRRLAAVPAAEEQPENETPEGAICKCPGWCGHKAAPTKGA